MSSCLKFPQKLWFLSLSYTRKSAAVVIPPPLKTLPWMWSIDQPDSYSKLLCFVFTEKISLQSSEGSFILRKKKNQQFEVIGPAKRNHRYGDPHTLSLLGQQSTVLLASPPSTSNARITSLSAHICSVLPPQPALSTQLGSFCKPRRKRPVRSTCRPSQRRLNSSTWSQNQST